MRIPSWRELFTAMWLMRAACLIALAIVVYLVDYMNTHSAYYPHSTQYDTPLMAVEWLCIGLCVVLMLITGHYGRRK